MLALSGFAVSAPNCLYSQQGIATNSIYRSLYFNNTHEWQSTSYAGTQQTAGKTTLGSASRVVKIISWVGTIATANRDSVLFNYSAGRGGAYELGNYGLFELRTVKYDNTQDYIIDIGTGVSTPNSMLTQIFDANNNVITRSQKEWVAATSTWRDVAEQRYTYDGGNKMLTNIWMGMNLSTGVLENVSKVTYAYTGSNLTAETGEQWDAVSGAWEQYTQSIYTYDGMNNVLSVNFKLWEVTTAAWVDYSKEIYTYDGANNMLIKLTQKWNSTAGLWKNLNREVHSYDASNNKTGTVYETWDNAAGSWEESSRTLNSSFTAHLPGQEIMQEWDKPTSAYKNMVKNTFTYNSFNQVTFFGQQSWDAAANDWDADRTNEMFYYESYASAVEPVANTNGSVKIYPVPASGSVTIEVLWDEAQDFSLAVMDQQGKVFEAKNIAPCQQYKGQLEVGALPAGNYILQLEGSKGKIVQRITVAR